MMSHDLCGNMRIKASAHASTADGPTALLKSYVCLPPTIYQVDWEHKMVTLGSKMLICAPTTVTMESFFCVILSLTTARLPTPSTSTHRITCI